jgi:pimeloyl-ACP methyl ester carboxylesterase
VTFRSVYTTTGAEAAVVVHGRNRPGGTPIVLCHGYNVGALQWYNAEGEMAHRACETFDITAIGADLGGTSTWGNAASITALDALITWAGTNYNTSTSKVALYGTSHGALTALNWAMRNPSKVAAMALTIPAVSLQGIHDRDPASLGLAAAIDTAYTNHAGYLTALPTRDPSTATNLRTLRDLGPITRIWYSTNDNVIDPTEVTTFASGTGSTLTSIGAQGHSLNTSQASVADWLGRMTKLAG